MRVSARQIRGNVRSGVLKDLAGAVRKRADAHDQNRCRVSHDCRSQPRILRCEALRARQRERSRGVTSRPTTDSSTIATKNCRFAAHDKGNRQIPIGQLWRVC